MIQYKLLLGLITRDAVRYVFHHTLNILHKSDSCPRLSNDLFWHFPFAMNGVTRVIEMLQRHGVWTERCVKEMDEEKGSQ